LIAFDLALGLELIRGATIALDILTLKPNL
jgi:hypothetical protein